MIWSHEALSLMKEINNFVINKYKILELDFDADSDDYIINYILAPRFKPPYGVQELYAFFGLKIYDIIDKHLSNVYYFDQVYADYPYRGIDFETNIFNSDNEIFNIADEFGLKIDYKNGVKEIFGRMRFLASKNIYDPIVANRFELCKVEYENPKYYESEYFKLYFKNYIKKHPKNLRYLDLLRKVLVKSYYFRRNIFIPLTKKDLIKVLEDPFIWVMLEPYNHIL
jgi:hypothetical protein